ncbi:MAG TPA: glycosyltransferase family 4 protein [Bryobacteraceae bacterium]|nr:glycosyltransferase family 4 protein [Bryobacteraceae bacterium]
MRIAIFDYRVVPTNPVGSCHLRMLAGLSAEHEFTVFAVQFENPAPDRIRWVRIRLPMRPHAVLYFLFHLIAPLTYVFHRLKTRTRFDLVQFVESNLMFGDVAYSHFCHRSYLRFHRPKGIAGFRGLARLISHRMSALMEPRTYRRVRHLVVPSRGLVGEISAEYKRQPSSMFLMPNPVDVERMRMPADFDRDTARRSHGFSSEDVVLLFVALGHFERKGLPLLLDAMRRIPDSPIHLTVVGGTKDTVAQWRRHADEAGLRGKVSFAGMHRDIRRYLWIADIFVLPSHYEVFPLVTLEAAAAGLPLLVTRLNGVEEFLKSGVNGFLVDRTAASIANVLSRLPAMTAQLREMGRNAQQDVQRYATRHFIARWREFYDTYCVLARAA